MSAPVLGFIGAGPVPGPDHGALYRALAERTIPLAIERGTLSPGRAKEIGAVLETGRQD